MIFESVSAIFHSKIPEFSIGIERATRNDVLIFLIGIERTYLNSMSLQAISNYQLSHAHTFQSIEIPYIHGTSI